VAPSDRRILSIALVVGLMAAMSLSACGRKGPLEAPPYAATAVAGEAAEDAEAAAAAAKPDRAFPLDFLLD
jgi:predicted small lipoprotein YifL